MMDASMAQETPAIVGLDSEMHAEVNFTYVVALL